GGGPVGMWLAAELQRGGVRPVVLERRAVRPPYSKALTIYPRTVEQFAMRGLVDRWLAEGTPVPSSHFALLTNRLDFSFLPTRYPYTLFLPQRRTEELLEAHLAELGIPYLREHAVTGLRQDEAGVELDVDTPAGATTRRVLFAVGCDGAASLVRTTAGTDFGMRETPDMWLSRVGNAARQAEHYRSGRILLAGDAAHIHYPAGGQGLNLGLQDAANLAWKLAAEIRGWAPPGLLDSYHAE